MRRPGLLGVALSGLLAAISVGVLAAPAAGLDPVAPKSELVFDNGGRIVSIAADGSARSVLTNRGIVTTAGIFGEVGDADPQVSPDGSHLLLARHLDDGEVFTEENFLVAGRDGTGGRRILRDRKRVSYDAPTWMPDGSILAVRRTGGRRKDRYALVNVRMDGRRERTMINLRPHLHRSFRLEMSTYFKPIDLAVSPDGGKVLITMSDGYKDDHRWLELADLGTGKRRNVARGGYSGSWSPDGSRIVYASNRDNKGEVCDFEYCLVQGDLFVADADGSNRTRLTRSRSDEGSPSWSPDGSRIAFSSNRNVPRSAAASEIYSITPEGECMTWLTNGSPASVTPSWVPSTGTDSNPGTCGAGTREPLTELRPLHNATLNKAPRLWAGPSIGERLLSGDSEFIGIEIMDYADCGAYDPADCPRPVSYASISSCFASGIWPSLLAKLKDKKLRKRRGVVVIRESKKSSGLTFFSGGSIGTISQGSILGAGGGPGKAKVRANYRFFDALRPVGSEARPDRLPALGIPKLDLRLMRAVRALVKRQGSVRKAADRIKAKPKIIREFLLMPRMLKRVGPIKPMNCPADFDPFAGYSNRKIENRLGARLPEAARDLIDRIRNDA